MRLRKRLACNDREIKTGMIAGLMLLLFMRKKSGFIFGRPFAQGMSS
jgi:hypothetical protein